MFATRTSKTLIGACLAPARLDRVLLAGVGLLLFSFPVVADEELGQRASWSNPQAAEVKAELDKWLATQQLDELSRLKIDALWPENAAPEEGLESLYRFAESVGVVDPRVAELMANCQSNKGPVALPNSDVLKDEKLAPAVRNNLLLFFGRWLAQRELYDEASEQLAGLKPEEVVDPASLLFYQGVVSHRLLKKDECLAAIDKLMENEDEIPRRYSVVARLMEADIRPLQQDSLDEVARMMDEIKRRLALGRAGERVRTQEDQVVAKLEKMIEKLEEGDGSKKPGAGNNPSSPLPDSVPAGGSGPGDVDPRRLTQGTNWGNLPQKERDEVLQQISKELPAHYREVIKEYFRKIARE